VDCTINAAGGRAVAGSNPVSPTQKNRISEPNIEDQGLRGDCDGDLTWPVRDVIELRQRVWQLAAESDIDLPRIVIDVYSRSEGEQSDDDAA